MADKQEGNQGEGQGSGIPAAIEHLPIDEEELKREAGVTTEQEPSQEEGSSQESAGEEGSGESGEGSEEGDLDHLMGNNNEEQPSEGEGEEGGKEPQGSEEEGNEEQPEEGSGEGSEEEAGEEDERSELEKKLGVGNEERGEEEGEETAVEDVSQLTKKAEEELGIKAEKPEDILKNAKDWKEKAENYEKVSNDFESLRQSIDHLPEDLKDGIRAYMDGEDHRQVINMRPYGIDFSKDVSELPEKDLVSTYYPDYFNQEDLEAIENGEADEQLQKQFDLAKNEAKNKFQNDQQVHQNNLQKKEEREREQKEKFEQSVEKSIEKFQEKFPNVDKAYLNEIKQQIENPADIFYNDDGTLKEDAVLKFVFSKDGNELLDYYQNKVKRQEQNKSTRNALKRSPENPDKGKSRGTGKGGKKGQEGKGDVSKETSELVTGLERLAENEKPQF
jgi:hypothetical protein